MLTKSSTYDVEDLPSTLPLPFTTFSFLRNPCLLCTREVTLTSLNTQNEKQHSNNVSPLTSRRESRKQMKVTGKYWSFLKSKNMPSWRSVQTISKIMERRFSKGPILTSLLHMSFFFSLVLEHNYLLLPRDLRVAPPTS